MYSLRVCGKIVRTSVSRAALQSAADRLIRDHGINIRDIWIRKII